MVDPRGVPRARPPVDARLLPVYTCPTCGDAANVWQENGLSVHFLCRRGHRGLDPFGGKRPKTPHGEPQAPPRGDEGEVR